MWAVVCACLALAVMTLHGCGGGSPSTTQTTSPAVPMITTSPYTYPDIENGTLTLAWRAISADSIQINLTATYTGSMTPGWLAIGWSADGQMANADFVIGYANCVRVQSNTKLGSPPSEKGNFTASGASFTLTNGGKNMMLSFTRPIIGKTPLTPAGNYVLTAAAQQNHVPVACDTTMTSANIHNLDPFGTEGSKFQFVTQPGQKVVV